MDYNENPVSIPTLLSDVLVQQGVAFIDEPQSYHHVPHQILHSTLYSNASALHVEIDLSQSLNDKAIHF